MQDLVAIKFFFYQIFGKPLLALFTKRAQMQTLLQKET